MISFENHIEIARRLRKSSPMWPTWRTSLPGTAIEKTDKVTSGPVGVGTKYRQRRSLPRPADETIQITIYQPPERLIVDGSLGPFTARMSYTFAETGGVTVLTNQVELTPTGPARLVALLAANRIKTAVLNNLAALKRILEQS